MFKAVRGEGMLNGVEFQAPSSFRFRMSYAAFQAIHTGLFGQMLVMRLFRNENVLSQICGNNFIPFAGGAQVRIKLPLVKVSA